VGLAFLGYLVGTSLGDDRIEGLVTAAPYFVTISALLAIGLYSSTHGIERTYLRDDLGTVLLAVTVGVFAKALLISMVMFAVFHQPEYLVLGVVVAQIDPLSVAALEKSSRMSKRGKALLLAWASFDDPVTTLLTVYAVGIALVAGALDGAGGGNGLADGGLAAFGEGLAWNLLLAGVVFAVWLLAFHRRMSRRRVKHRGGETPTGGFVAQCVLLGAAAVAAVWQFWMLAIALIGLFLRPQPSRDPDGFGRFLARLTTAAFALATVALGIILVPDVRWVPGLVLGVAAFVAQAIAGTVLGRKQQRTDRISLGLAQQNGITAIVLALLLESSFPGTVAVVAPAILVINVLHVVLNGAYDAAAHRRVRDAVRTGAAEPIAARPRPVGLPTEPAPGSLSGDPFRSARSPAPVSARRAARDPRT
jgi:NhaP-type Na+/H+ or K+/H+ antiporter